MSVTCTIRHGFETSKIGQEQNNRQQVERREDDENGKDKVVLAYPEEKDHRHDEGEQVQIGALAGTLHIAKKKRMQIDKDDAKQFRHFEQAPEIAKQEVEKNGDAGDFYDGTPCHPIYQVINKIDSIACHCQYDEDVPLPEFSGIYPRGSCRGLG